MRLYRTRVLSESLSVSSSWRVGAANCRAHAALWITNRAPPAAAAAANELSEHAVNGDRLRRRRSLARADGGVRPPRERAPRPRPRTGARSLPAPAPPHPPPSRWRDDEHVSFVRGLADPRCDRGGRLGRDWRRLAELYVRRLGAARGARRRGPRTRALSLHTLPPPPLFPLFPFLPGAHAHARPGAVARAKVLSGARAR